MIRIKIIKNYRRREFSFRTRMTRMIRIKNIKNYRRREFSFSNTDDTDKTDK